MRIRTQMPDLKGEELLLNKENFSDEENAVTLIYFWSMSCKLCEESLQRLKELKNRYPKLIILTIHMPRDPEDHDITAIKQRLHKFAFPFPVYIDQQLRLTNAFGTRMVPSYYLFDEKKKLRFYQAGVVSKRLLQQKIERFIL